ncbi:AAA family ATPase [bacterium]|nr:AAA family ATPase [bacterium]
MTKNATVKKTVPELSPGEKRRLRSHFGFSRAPFSKHMWAANMFDSGCQRELLAGLNMWIELKGISLATGPSGVGKSISLRRFVQTLDESRYTVIDFSYLPTTLTGFLRSLNRKLGLPMRLHGADLFDQAQRHLVAYEAEHATHPVLLIDDAEGLTVPVIDALRRLTAYQMDGEDHFSLLLSGTDDLLKTLRHPGLEPLRSRIGYAQHLRPFALEDTRNYIRYHLERADTDARLFSDEANKRIFQASQGRPRSINQLATQALIQAAVHGRDGIDGDFMTHLIAAHPLYQHAPGAQR